MKLKFKLGLSNFEKNKNVYIPYVLLVSLTFFLIFSILNLKSNPTLENIRGFRSISQILSIALPVFIFFFFLLIYNVNQFSFKYRSKNFGLYNVLGLSKGEIVHIYYIEIFLVLVSGLLIGLPLAIILDMGLYQVFLAIMNVDVTLGYYLSINSMILSAILIFVILFISTLFATKEIYKSNSIELLKEESQGEKEPKYNLLFALFGLLLLFSAYWYASQIDTNFLKQENILQLFISIIAVVIATFILFVSSSLWILNLLKKNTGFYYKSSNMIVISNLLFRLKKNAFSLAGIAILSSMAIFVTAVSSIFVLSLNQKPALPLYDLNIGYSSLDGNVDIESFNQLTISQNTQNLQYQFIHTLKMTDVNLDFESDSNFGFYNKQDLHLNGWLSFYLMDINEYQHVFNSNQTLNKGEVIVALDSNYGSSENIDYLKMKDTTYKLNSIVDVNDLGFPLFRIVIMNTDDLNELKNELFSNDMNSISDYQYFSYNLITNSTRVSDEIYFNQATNFNLNVPYGIGYSINFLRINADEMFMVYSGLLFIGFYFVIVFILSLFSLMYFKFFQEALEDQKRYKSLQQVGLSPDETSKTINTQISTLFFLPLLVAVIHIFFARQGIEMIQILFGETSVLIRNMSILISVIFFVLLYLILYVLIKKLVHKLITQ